MPDYDTKNPILDPVEPPAEGVTPPVGTFERPDVGAGARRLEGEPRGTAAVAELLSAVRDLREDLSRVFGASKEVVRERPMTSLLVAAGAGCCLGLLLTRGLRTDDDYEH